MGTFERIALSMDAEETLQYLRGRWRVRRDVTDHRAAEHGIFVGTATFSPHGETDARTLHFEEDGQMQLGSHEGRASRQLNYSVAGDRIAVMFSDGRHFIDLDLRDGTSHAVHVCNIDRYEITTVVKNPDLFEERWRVEGPEKDYQAVTTLERVTDQL